MQHREDSVEGGAAHLAIMCSKAAILLHERSLMHSLVCVIICTLGHTQSFRVS
jgi:hypothetical protein